MRYFFFSFLGVLAAFALMFILMMMTIIGIASSGSSEQAAAEKADKILELDLRYGLLDHPNTTGFSFSEPRSVVSLVQAIDRGKADDTVKGIFIRANSWSVPPAQAEEINRALADFKDGGKFVVAHAQGFEGTSVTSYASVASASEIWLQDTAGFSVAGFRAEVPFYGGVFEKFEAVPQFEQFHEYKNAANVYTEKTFTDAHRESTTSLLSALMDDSVALISTSRSIDSARLRDAFENAPHSAEDALELGLVDNLGHLIDARDRAEELSGNENVTFVDIFDGYGGTPHTKGPTIAMIGGQGPIVTGSSNSGNPFANDVIMGSDTVSAGILEAAENDSVEAIILRVDSPGGSAIASDQVWDAVNRAKDAGKPVVISMGQYAASGGYYVSANADHIVALPTTITGSIGVLGGKIVLKDTFGLIDYNVEAINEGGDWVAAYSAIEPFNQSNRAAFRNSMSDIYDDFTRRVADGRGMSIEQAREIAKGRVWTGTQALDIGLVDELGGFTEALAAAKRLAEIDPDASVKLVTYPAAEDDFTQLLRMLNVSAESAATLQDLEALTQSPEFQALMEARALADEKRQMELMATIPDIK